MNNKNQYLLLALAIVFTFSSCEKEDDNPEIPSTYSFDNVSYGGQTARLDMLAEMTAELKKSNAGTMVDATTLLNMFANENNPFSETTLNESGKDLKSKCFSAGGGAYSASTFEYLINYMSGISSQAGNAWAPGSAGVATSGSKAYFFDEYGVEYTQIIEKGLMGAVFYYQAAEVYTRPGKIGDAVDNETVIPGEGTDMEHHWDEAFGFFGIPTDLTIANFEAKLTNGEVRYHGKYAGVGQDAGLNTVQKVLDQMIKGRYGISNIDYTLRDEAAAQLRAEWEMVLATAAIHYLNSAQSNFAEDALRNHALSEAYAFIISLNYNSDKLISSSEIASVTAYFQEVPIGAPNPVPSFINVTNQDLTDAKSILSSIYGLDAVKDVL
ncbi:MAG: hypothetical protein ACI9O4_000350 [Chitinophagales bacterium]|jgi:hypothetical protein